MINACEVLSDSLENEEYYLQYHRLKSLRLLENCLNYLRISSPEWQELSNSIHRIESRFDVTCLVDVVHPD